MANEVDKYRKIVRKLAEDTKRGVVTWDFADWSSTLGTTLAGFRIQLESGTNPEGEPIVSVSIRDSNNNIVDWFTDETITGEDPGVPGFQSYWALLSDLRHSAQRQAAGADKALDAILDALDDNVPF